MNSKIVPLDEELKRNPELKKSDIQLIREWMKTQPHLPEITDSEIAIFLHSKYFELEPTKKLIENFYSMRTHIPEFFQNRVYDKDENMKKIAKSIAILPLDKRTRDGYKVFYAGLMDFDPANFDFTVYHKLKYMIFDLWMFPEGTHPGYIVIINANGGQMAHAARTDMEALKRAIQFIQDALPFRHKGLHFINTNTVISTVFNIVKSYMKKEFFELFHFHSNVETLEEHGISVDMLPNEAGGKAGKHEDLQVVQIKKILENQDYFDEEEKTRRVDESKRPGKPKTAADFFGAKVDLKALDFD